MHERNTKPGAHVIASPAPATPAHAESKQSFTNQGALPPVGGHGAKPHATTASEQAFGKHDPSATLHASSAGLDAVDRALAAAHKSGSRGDLPPISAQLDAIKERLDTLSDLGNEVSLELEMYQERYAHLREVLSNMMKSSAETDSNITGNLK